MLNSLGVCFGINCVRTFYKWVLRVNSSQGKHPPYYLAASTAGGVFFLKSLLRPQIPKMTPYVPKTHWKRQNMGIKLV